MKCIRWLSAEMIPFPGDPMKRKPKTELEKLALDKETV